MRPMRVLAAASFAAFVVAGCSGNRTSSSPTAPEEVDLSLQAPPDPVEQSLAASWGWFKPTEYYSSNVPVAWFNLAYQLVRDEKLTPPVASRVFGYAGVALYEAVVPGMDRYRSLAGQVNQLPPVPVIGSFASHWPAAANKALATVFADLFASGTPATQAAITNLYDSFNAQFQVDVPHPILVLSNLRGQKVGDAINRWAHEDGYTELHNCAFTPPVGPGLWVPTPPGYLAPLEPC